MESGKIELININKEMRQSYLSYAMSVIVSRALPDARDGMKPVQRRILYAMHDMGLVPNRSHKKSARIVGEVLGKYHPHGDQSVYDAMVRMAQDFSLRYPMVDGQGNFGSIDGDGAAAMRYTEVRLTRPGYEMLNDLGKETVDFNDNFDGSLKEPSVLPATVPSLLVNGSSGIAVGMSTSMPPHNMAETIDALNYMLKNWDKHDDITVLDLMKFMKGPDFPTGGIIFRYKDEVDAIAQAYATGRGRITVRAQTHIEQMGRNKSRIIVTELPYQVNKTNLLTRIAKLHRDGKLEGLTDLRDESSRLGMRIILETTRNIDPRKLLKQLFQMTPMQTTFSIINVALVKDEPKVLSLKQLLRIFLDHRLEIVRRRSEYDLKHARARAHILEGLLKALDHIDAVIETIRRSRTTETARDNLQKKFKFSLLQAKAILEMRLRRLAGLERSKLKDEYRGLTRLIKQLEKLLNTPQLMRDTVGKELDAVREAYQDKRKTAIIDKDSTKVVTSADMIGDKKVWVIVGEDGLIARTHDDKLFTIPSRPSSIPLNIHPANSRDILYLIAANGEAVSLPVYKLPKANAASEGEHWSSLTGFAKAAHLAASIVLPQKVIGKPDSGYLLLGTLGGTVKRLRVEDLPGAVSDPFTVIRVASDDALGWARWTSGVDEVLLATANGQLIRFKESDIRPSGAAAGGVAGIKFRNEADGVIGLETISPIQQADKKQVALVWSITDNGLAKVTAADEYPTQKRRGYGVVNIKLPVTSEEVVAMSIGDRRGEIYVKTAYGSLKRMRIGKAALGSRAKKPTAVIKAGPRSRVTGILRVARRIEIDDETPAAEQLALL